VLLSEDRGALARGREAGERASAGGASAWDDREERRRRVARARFRLTLREPVSRGSPHPALVEAVAQTPAERSFVVRDNNGSISPEVKSGREERSITADGLTRPRPRDAQNAIVSFSRRRPLCDSVARMRALERWSAAHLLRTSSGSRYHVSLALCNPRPKRKSDGRESLPTTSAIRSSKTFISIAVGGPSTPSRRSRRPYARDHGGGQELSGHSPFVG
jgi:hypothetical protein